MTNPTVTTGGIGCSVCGTIVPWGAWHSCFTDLAGEHPSYYELAWKKAQADVAALRSQLSERDARIATLEAELSEANRQTKIAREKLGCQEAFNRDLESQLASARERPW